jgi:hypothetical protein
MKIENTIKSKLKTVEATTNNVLAYPLLWVLQAFTFKWYDYIWVQKPLPYWKWYVIAAALSLATFVLPKWLKRVKSQILMTLLGIAIFLQVLNWLGLVKFPIIG